MQGYKNTSQVRIASYNMRKARGLDQRRDPARILSVLNRLDADIIALQEADLRLGDRPAALSRRMIEDETDFQVVPIAKNDVSIGWHGNAVLVRKPLITQSMDWIEMPGLEPRGAVRVTLEIGVTLVATHLGLLRRHRRRQLKAISDALGDTPNAIIAGDFNEWRHSFGLEPLAPRYDVLSPGQSFHAARPVAALDRIAYTRDLQVYQAGVDQSPLACKASDHLPIWADITPR